MNSTCFLPVHRSQRHGAAMLMVMVVLALLLILAVSFTFLMSQQEGASAAALGHEQTRIVTRTGADHAYARLSHANRLNQYQRWLQETPADVTDFDNPYVDVRDEMFVSLRRDFEGPDALFMGATDNQGRALFPVSDPRRLVQGLTVSDETGKANLNFSTLGTLANLLGSTLVVQEVPSEGGVFPEVILDDAAFLDDYDRESGGYVVINHQLMRYSARRGNVLYNVIPNPVYNAMPGGTAIFTWGPPGRPIREGEFVTTPTPYKVIQYRLLNSREGVPAWFNHVSDIRRIAELPRMFSPDSSVGPEILGGRLDGWPEGIAPLTYQMLLENATAISPTPRFDGGWFMPHVVTWGGMVSEGESGLQTMVVRFEQVFRVPGDPRGGSGTIGPDNLVRLRNARGDVILGWARAGGQGTLALVVEGAHELDIRQGWIIEAAERAEVNLNTVNFETLVAYFHGVAGITRTEARTLARRVLAYLLSDELDERGRVPAFRNEGDLWRLLRELSQEQGAAITAGQIGALAAQQRNPYAGGRPTIPLRFSSADVYMVDALATSYLPAGMTRARSGFREWVQIGSDRERTLHWHYFPQLQQEITTPQGNVLQLHPAGLRNRRLIGLLELPYLRYNTERYQRGWRAQPWTEAQARNMAQLAANDGERFYANIEEVTSATGATYDGGDLESGAFSLWYRRQWQNLDANHYVFDVAEQEFSNRMSLLWWGNRRGQYNLQPPNAALTLRIKDRTLEEAFTELRYELTDTSFRRNEWYHLAANWKGTDLSHLSLLIDGDASAGGVTPQVKHAFREINGAWVNRTSTLQVALEDPKLVRRTQTEIVIDPTDIDAFPDRGVVVIGDEAIEYHGKLGSSLINIYRGPPNPEVEGSATGARGTVAKGHPRGSKVTVFGYTAPLRPIPTTSWPEPTVDVTHGRPIWPHLPRTIGSLTSVLPVNPFQRIEQEGSDNPSYYRAKELGPDAGFAGAGAPGGNPDLLPLADYSNLPERGVLFVYGPAFRGYLQEGTTSYPDWAGNGNPQQLMRPPLQFRPELLRWEYVAYNGISAQGLRVVGRYTYDSNPESPTFQRYIRKDPEQAWHFLGSFETDLFETSDSEHIQNMIDFFSRGTRVALASIPVDSAAGYHPSSVVQVNDEWLRYTMVWNPEGPREGDENLMQNHAPFPALINLGNNQLLSIRRSALDPAQPLVPMRPWRGACATPIAPHGVAARVIPTFGTTARTGDHDAVTLVIGKNSQKEEHRIRNQRSLHDQWQELNLFTVGSGGAMTPLTSEDHYIAALYEHTGRDYPANRLLESNPDWRFNPAGTNLCKFPTGELPVELPTTWTFNGADPRTREAGSTSNADYDSFELRRFGAADFALLADVSPADTEMLVRRIQGIPPYGVIKLNDELIYYRSVEARNAVMWDPAQNNYINLPAMALRDASRGVLGTRPVAHSGGTLQRISGASMRGGTPYMNMASMRAGHFVEAIPPRERVVNAIIGESSLRPYGFARIEDGGNLEVIGYQRYDEIQTEDPNNPGNMLRTGRITAGDYHSADWPQGLFRGAFGTTARQISSRALVFDQPVRFPDWFAGFSSDGAAAYMPGAGEARSAIPGAVSPEITYFQGATTLRNSLFTRFRWRIQYAPNADPAIHAQAINARVVIRFKEAGKPLPEWDSLPTNAPGGLWAFDFDVTGGNTQDLGNTLYEQTQDFTRYRGLEGGLRADRLEWRVYFYFRRNAFQNEIYKTTLQFQGASVDVNQLTRVLRHEERR